MHLITDVKFYNELIKGRWTKEIYNDYDRINKKLVEKYNIEIPKEVQEYVSFKRGKLHVFTENEIYEFIEEMGKIHLTI